MTHPAPRRHHNARSRSPWLLPDDGIIDPLAVDLAARGVRPVALTHTERRIAAARILAAGGTAHTIARRLRMSHESAQRLAAQITTAGRDAA